jgi:3',5'-cyclic AMP phosphodiesterase CpdA
MGKCTSITGGFGRQAGAFAVGCRPDPSRRAAAAIFRPGMRIVALADTHLFHGELIIPAGDVLVHAGDMCRGGDLAELAEAARFLTSLPHRTKIVVAGNHDWAFVDEPEAAREALGGGVVYLEDSGVVVDGVPFWGSPWQPAYNDWAFNLPRGDALARKWALVPEGTVVLVTHGPPLGKGDGSSVDGRAGCAELLARVRAVRPRLHLFGHIHEDGGASREGETTFVNATTWECERAPTVVDLDPHTGEVVLVEVPPARALRPS